MKIQHRLQSLQIVFSSEPASASASASPLEKMFSFSKLYQTKLTTASDLDILAAVDVRLLLYF